MFGIAASDPDRTIDWSLAANDYAKHRPGQPDSFFMRLRALGLGVEGQRTLDLGTGTGDLARRFATHGCIAFGTDISAGQIAQARALATTHRLNAVFSVAVSDAQPFPSAHFDVITANQCWVYFKQPATWNEIVRLLKPQGLLCISSSSWLPRVDPIARASEAQVLKFNPQWGGKDWSGEVPAAFPEMDARFEQRAMFFYDEPLPFTRESWRGRMRACRGTGATLSADQLAAFDSEHAAMLSEVAPASFTIQHRITAHILALKE